MDCLKSFNFTLSQQSNYTAANGFKHWSLGTQHNFLLEREDLSGSIYTIQGFKNINIFKIEINGDVYSSALPVNVSALVQNWNFIFEISGQNSPIVGFVSSGSPFGLSQQAIDPIIMLSKFQKSIYFVSPIQSAKQIKVRNFYCDGISNQSILSAQIGFFMTVTVFYKYEGE